jgi:hypothetical protein
MADGVRLARMTDGCEGQVWRSGFLAATRWWPTIPALNEWTTFLRVSGVDVSRQAIDGPQPVDSQMLAAPWTVGNTQITDVWTLLQNERVAAIAACVVAAPFLYLLGEGIALSVANARVDAELAQLASANQSVRADRSAALSNLDAVESYMELDNYPTQFEVITAAAAILQPRNVTILEWTYDSGNLEILLHADRPLDATFFIEAFERTPMFGSVSASTENQERDLRMKMQVEPRVMS